MGASQEVKWECYIAPHGESKRGMYIAVVERDGERVWVGSPKKKEEAQLDALWGLKNEKKKDLSR